MVYVFAVFLIIYVLCCMILVGFILTQEGKGGGLSGVMGASMGETFGFGGATATIRKFTAIAATVFLLFTVILTFLGERVVESSSASFFNAGTENPTTLPSSSGTVPASSNKPAAKSAAPAAAPTVVEASSPTEVPASTAASQTAPAPAPAATAEASAKPADTANQPANNSPAAAPAAAPSTAETSPSK